MRGPIDYIIVGFEGNQFDGSIVKAISDAEATGAIALVAMKAITKDADGNVAALEVTGNDYPDTGIVTQDDLDEVADLLENNTTAGLLVVEQLWAKPLKKALIDANGVLVAEGRIHPEAALELDKENE